MSNVDIGYYVERARKLVDLRAMEVEDNDGEVSLPKANQCLPS